MRWKLVEDFKLRRSLIWSPCPPWVTVARENCAERAAHHQSVWKPGTLGIAEYLCTEAAAQYTHRGSCERLGAGQLPLAALDTPSPPCSEPLVLDSLHWLLQTPPPPALGRRITHILFCLLPLSADTKFGKTFNVFLYFGTNEYGKRRR